MKKVIVAIQSTLVREAVIGALEKRGLFVEKSLSQLLLHSQNKLIFSSGQSLSLFAEKLVDFRCICKTC